MLSKNVIINVCCFLWISLISLVGAAPVDAGGAGINAFFVLVLWGGLYFYYDKITTMDCNTRKYAGYCGSRAWQ